LLEIKTPLFCPEIPPEYEDAKELEEEEMELLTELQLLRLKSLIPIIPPLTELP
jgi:hypothetical protein